jgi:predicted outer membrane repeat protein
VYGGTSLTYDYLTNQFVGVGFTNDGHGGALYVAGGSVTLTNDNLYWNSAFGLNGYGGGIGGVGVTISGCTFTSNSATSGGGIDGSNMTVSNCTFASNSALGGGAIRGSSMDVSGCTFTGNTAARGGAIYLDLTGNFIIDKSTLTGNSASSFGGGIYIQVVSASYDSQYAVTLTNDVVMNNVAGYTGGGILIEAGAPVHIDAFTAANIIGNSDSSGLNGRTANIDGAYVLLP